MAGDVGAERESNSCLKGSSEVLLPPSPGAAVLDSNLVDRDNLERTSSFEGNLPLLWKRLQHVEKEICLSISLKPQVPCGLHHDAAYERN